MGFKSDKKESVSKRSVADTPAVLTGGASGGGCSTGTCPVNGPARGYDEDLEFSEELFDSLIGAGKEPEINQDKQPKLSELIPRNVLLSDRCHEFGSAIALETQIQAEKLFGNHIGYEVGGFFLVEKGDELFEYRDFRVPEDLHVTTGDLTIAQHYDETARALKRDNDREGTRFRIGSMFHVHASREPPRHSTKDLDVIRSLLNKLAKTTRRVHESPFYLIRDRMKREYGDTGLCVRGDELSDMVKRFIYPDDEMFFSALGEFGLSPDKKNFKKADFLARLLEMIELDVYEPRIVNFATSFVYNQFPEHSPDVILLAEERYVFSGVHNKLELNNDYYEQQLKLTITHKGRDLPSAREVSDIVRRCVVFEEPYNPNYWSGYVDETYEESGRVIRSDESRKPALKRRRSKEGSSRRRSADKKRKKSAKPTDVLPAAVKEAHENALSEDEPDSLEMLLESSSQSMVESSSSGRFADYEENDLSDEAEARSGSFSDRVMSMSELAGLTDMFSKSFIDYIASHKNVDCWCAEYCAAIAGRISEEQSLKQHFVAGVSPAGLVQSAINTDRPRFKGNPDTYVNLSELDKLIEPLGSGIFSELEQLRSRILYYRSDDDSDSEESIGKIKYLFEETVEFMEAFIDEETLYHKNNLIANYSYRIRHKGNIDLNTLFAKVNAALLASEGTDSTESGLTSIDSATEIPDFDISRIDKDEVVDTVSRFTRGFINYIARINPTGIYAGYAASIVKTIVDDYTVTPEKSEDVIPTGIWQATLNSEHPSMAVSPEEYISLHDLYSNTVALRSGILSELESLHSIHEFHRSDGSDSKKIVEKISWVYVETLKFMKSFNNSYDISDENIVIAAFFKKIHSTSYDVIFSSDVKKAPDDVLDNLIEDSTQDASRDVDSDVVQISGQERSKNQYNREKIEKRIILASDGVTTVSALSEITGEFIGGAIGYINYIGSGHRAYLATLLKSIIVEAEERGDSDDAFGLWSAAIYAGDIANFRGAQFDDSIAYVLAEVDTTKRIVQSSVVGEIFGMDNRVYNHNLKNPGVQDSFIEFMKRGCNLTVAFLKEFGNASTFEQNKLLYDFQRSVSIKMEN